MSNSFETSGTVRVISDTQQVKDTFRKREFVIEVEDGQYPQHIKFQVTQDRCNLLDSIAIGTDVTVSFNLRGRPFQAKDGTTQYFTNLEAWRIKAGAATAPDHTQRFDEPAF